MSSVRFKNKPTKNKVKRKTADAVGSPLKSNQNHRSDSGPSRLSAQYRGAAAVALGASVQRKVTVGRAGDNYEREADKVAEHVTAGRQAPEISRIPPGGLKAQGKEDADEQAQSYAVQPVPDEGSRAEADETAQSQDTDKEDAAAQAQSKDDESQSQDEASAEGATRASAEEAQSTDDAEVQSKCDGCGQERVTQRTEDDSAEAAAQPQSEPSNENAAQMQPEEDADAGDSGAPETNAQMAADDDGQASAGSPEPSAGDAQAGMETEAQDEGEPQAGEQREEDTDTPDEQLDCGQETGGGGEAGGGEDSGGCGSSSEQAAEEPAAESDAAAESAAEQAGETQTEASPREASGQGCGASANAESNTESQTTSTAGDELAQEQPEEVAEPPGPVTAQNQEDESAPAEDGDSDSQAQAVQASEEDATQEASADGEAQESAAESEESSTADGAQLSEDESAPSSDRESDAQAKADASGMEDVAQEEQADEPAQENAAEENGESTAVDQAQMQDDAGSEASSGESTQEVSAEADDTQRAEEAESGESEAQSKEENGEIQTKADTRRGRRDRDGRKGAIAARAIHSRDAGTPLTPSTRENLEQSLGFDLSSVRVHSDSRAREASRGMRAKAFTHKNHIWLGAGQSQDDLKLMAHEVTHSVQQGAVDVSRPATGQRRETSSTQSEHDAASNASSRGRQTDNSGAPANSAGGSEATSSTGKAGGFEQKDESLSNKTAPAADIAPSEREMAAPQSAGGNVDNAVTSPRQPVPAAPLLQSNARVKPVSDPSSIEEHPGVDAAASQLPAAASPGQSSVASEATRSGGPQVPPSAASSGMATHAPARSPGAAGEPVKGEVAEGVSGAMPTHPVQSGHPGQRTTAAGMGSGQAAVAGGGAATSLSVSMDGAVGEPSALISRFREVSPIRAPRQMKPLSKAVGQALQARRSVESAASPQAVFRPAPAGMTPAQPAAGTREDRPVSTVDHLPISGDEPPPEAMRAHQHGPFMVDIPDPAETTRELERIPEDNSTLLQQQVQRWITRHYGYLPTSDSGLNTNPGPSPSIRLGGRSDPSQIQQLNIRGRTDLNRRAVTSAQDREQDFGEGKVAPEMEPETIESLVPPQTDPNAPQCPQAQRIEPYRFDPVDEMDLSKRVRSKQAAEYDREERRLQHAEHDRDSRIAREKEQARQQVQIRHADAHAEQLQARAQVQEEVTLQKRLWSERDRALLREYDVETTVKGSSAKQEIQAHQQREQSTIDRRHQGVKQQARKEQSATEQRIDEIKREGRKKSGSWFSRAGRWIKNQVKRLASWISEKVSQAMRALREKVAQMFADFKAWALEQIEKARKWAIDRLEVFRKLLHGLVDKYLGRFPALARIFKGAIDTGIGLAKRAVNAAARRLKKAVTLIIDGLAKAVDGLLGVFEGLVQFALWTLCNLVVTGVNIAVVLVDQDIESLIELIKDLPEPEMLGPLWPAIKYALLGYLERLRDKPADEKKRYERKTRQLATSFSYYGGVFLGVLKGFVWDGLVGLVRMLYDIVVGIPKAIKAVYDYFSSLLRNVEAIQGMITEAQGIWAELKAFMQRPDAAEQIIAYMKQAPQILHSMVRDLYRRVKGWAYRAGAKAADALFSFVLNNSAFEIGIKVGSVVGRVLFEIALLVFSSGVGTLVKWGGKALQILGKAGRWMKSAMRGGGMILRGLRALKQIVVRGVRMAQRIGRSLRGVFVRLERLVQRVFAWFTRGMRRLRPKRGYKPKRLKTRKSGKTPRSKARPRTKPRTRPKGKARRKRRRWRRFKMAVRRLAVKYDKTGVTRARLRAELKRLRARYMDVVGHVGVMRRPVRKRPFWTLKARRRGLRYRFLPAWKHRVLQDRDSRWRRGVAAVRRRLRRVRDSERNEAALDRMLKHFERRWRFRRLDAVTDTKENDFNIMAGMSPDVEIAEVAAKSEWPKGTRNDPIPVKWFKKPSDYALIGGKTISSGVTLPEVGGRGRRTLFVNPSYLSMKDVVTKHRPARPKDLKKDQIRGHLRALYELPDDGGRITVTEGASTLVPGKYQIDHVRDLNWKGRDIYSNLWPASETKNNAFNANNDQYVKAQMWKGGKWKTERHSARHWGNFGKYFWIADQVNVPASRGNPAGGKTPINDGKHGIPKRKPGSS